MLEGCGWWGREGQAAAGALDQPSSGPRLAACCISCHSRLLRCCRASFCPPFCFPSAPLPSVLPSPSPVPRDRKGAAAPGRLCQRAAPTPPPNTHNRSPHLLSPPSLLPDPACCCFGCATGQAKQPQAAAAAACLSAATLLLGPTPKTGVIGTLTGCRLRRPSLQQASPVRSSSSCQYSCFLPGPAARRHRQQRQLGHHTENPASGCRWAPAVPLPLSSVLPRLMAPLCGSSALPPGPAEKDKQADSGTQSANSGPSHRAATAPPPETLALPVPAPFLALCACTPGPDIQRSQSAQQGSQQAQAPDAKAAPGTQHPASSPPELPTLPARALLLPPVQAC